jgi:hypothetical protein
MHLQHVLHSRSNIQTLREHLHAGEVNIQMGMSLQGVQHHVSKMAFSIYILKTLLIIVDEDSFIMS